MAEIDISKTGRLGQELSAVPRGSALAVFIDGKQFAGAASYEWDMEKGFVLELRSPKKALAKKAAKKKAAK